MHDPTKPRSYAATIADFDRRLRALESRSVAGAMPVMSGSDRTSGIADSAFLDYNFLVVPCGGARLNVLLRYEMGSLTTAETRIVVDGLTQVGPAIIVGVTGNYEVTYDVPPEWVPGERRIVRVQTRRRTGTNTFNLFGLYAYWS